MVEPDVDRAVAVVMALGGALSLSDRRLRVGAPKPARMKRVLQPAE